MSRQRFQARAKRVQKLGRDGLVEQNLATGEERRVSQREADVSFGPERPQEQAAGHRAAQRLGKKRHKQPRPPQPTSEEAVRASTPEPIADNRQEAAPSMRGAADTPMLTTPSSVGEPLVEPLPQPEKKKRSRKRARRNARKKKQAQSHALDAARPVEEQPAHLRTAGDRPVENRPVDSVGRQSPHPATTGERLKFEIPPAITDTETGAKDTEKVHQQEQWSTPDAVKPDESSGRQHFEAAEEVTTPALQIAQTEPSPKAPVSKGKGRRRPYTRAGAAVPVDTRSEQRSVEPSTERGRLQFETKGPAQPTDRAAVKHRQMSPFTVHADAAAQPEEPRPQREEPAPIPERITEQPQSVGVTPTDAAVKPKGTRLQFEGKVPAPPPERTVEQPQTVRVAPTDAAAKPKGLRLRFGREKPAPPERTIEKPQTVKTVHTDAAVAPKGTRLRFEPEKSPPPSDQTVTEHREIPAHPAPVDATLQPEAQVSPPEQETVNAVHTDTHAHPEGPHLRFEPTESAPLITAQMVRKNRQAQYAAANPDGARQRFGPGKPAPLHDQTAAKEPQATYAPPTDASPEVAHSQSEPDEPAPPTEQTVAEGRQAGIQDAYADAATQPKRTRLRFEDNPTPEAGAAPPSKGEDAPPKQRRGYDRAVRRVEKAEQHVEDARENLPKTRRLSVRKEIDGETGQLRHRLHFEQEVKPEYAPPMLPERAGQTVKTAAVMKLHSKIHESERDNVAVEAAHKSELTAEQGAGTLLRWNSRRQRSKPYRALRRAEQQAAKENVNLAWQTAIRDNPELQKKNALAKWVQKQQIKGEYAQAAREAKETAQFTRNVADTTAKFIHAVARYVSAHKFVLLVMAVLVVLLLLVATGLTSGMAMLSGVQASYASASYLADEQDICNADLYYTELETDLQIDIDNTASSHPGYDEYRYNIGEISHSPYELYVGNGQMIHCGNPISYANINSNY